MNRTLKYTIDELNNNITAQNYLKSLGFSSQNITELKKMPQNLLINGKFSHMRDVLKTGDTVIINITETNISEKIPPAPIPLDIIYEDEDLIVLNKPADMPVHPSLNNYDNTLANGLAYYYQNQKLPFVFRCLTRLDRDTSGLTVIAKNMVSASILSTQLKDGTLNKEYRCIVKGMPQLKGQINAPIARVSDSIITRTVDFKNGIFAVTDYEVIDNKNGYSLISVRLQTGRTHQIRVHFKYIGYPLAGDGLYNPDNTDIINRQALHCYKLRLNQPITKEPLEFIAPIPNDMQALLN